MFSGNLRKGVGHPLNLTPKRPCVPQRVLQRLQLKLIPGHQYCLRSQDQRCLQGSMKYLPWYCLTHLGTEMHTALLHESWYPPHLRAIKSTQTGIKLRHWYRCLHCISGLSPETLFSHCIWYQRGHVLIGTNPCSQPQYQLLQATIVLQHSRLLFPGDCIILRKESLLKKLCKTLLFQYCSDICRLNPPSSSIQDWNPYPWYLHQCQKPPFQPGGGCYF